MQIDMIPFEKLIREKTGLSVKKDTREYFCQKICQRISEKKANTAYNYLNLIKKDSDEFYHIVNFLTINETYFYREPLHIALFSQHIVPEILRNRSSCKPVRILSAGVSTGEEAYTLAIELFETYGMYLNNKHFSIIGVDIDRGAIEKAKQGIYFGRSFRSLSPHLRQKYFEPLGSHRYSVKKHIRDIAEFYFLNLMDTPYPDFMKGMDIIFYRNVSIYFDSDVQKKIFENLSEVLNDNGYLILGSAETLSHTFDILPLVEISGVFLYHKKKAEVREQPYLFCEPQFTVSTPPLLQIINSDHSENFENSENSDPCFDDALAYVRKKNYVKAFEVLDSMIESDTDTLRAYCLKTHLLINLQQLEEAKKICLKIIEKDSLCAEGYFLSALIARLGCQHDIAVKRFKEAVYLNQSSWIAHFYLAQEYQALGEEMPARREYSIVMKLLEKGLFKDHGLVFFPFSFTEDDVIRLCRYHIGKQKRG